MKSARRLWPKIKEPRVINFLAWTGYVVLMIGGAYALLDPPSTIEGVAGLYTMRAVAAFVLLGAAAGAIGALPGWRAVERWGIGLSSLGITIYLALVTSLHFFGSGNRSFQAAIVYFALVSLIGRYLRIHEGVFDPGSRASRRARARHPTIGVDTGPHPRVDPST